MDELCRFQVDIPKHQLEELEELQRLGNLRSKRELWDTAFTLLKWAAKKRSLGLSVGSMGKDGAYTELEMPFLEHYATSMRRGQAENPNNSEADTPAENDLAVTGVTVPISRTGNGNGNISLARKRQRA